MSVSEGHENKFFMQKILWGSIIVDLFCYVWRARRTTRSNLTKPKTFSIGKPRGSNSGMRCSLVFWRSLYKDYSPLSIWASTFKAQDDLGLKDKVVSLSG